MGYLFEDHTVTCKFCVHKIDASCYRFPPTAQLIIQEHVGFIGPEKVQAIISLYPGVQEDTKKCGEYEVNFDGLVSLHYGDDTDPLLS